MAAATREYTMSVDVTRDSLTCQPPTQDAEKIATEIFRDLARWLYLQLRAEYGPVPVSFRSGDRVKRPFVRRPCEACRINLMAGPASPEPA